MLNSEQIQKLKQTNISVDGDKTRERVESLWKGASNARKQEILETADVVAATFYRVYRTGSVSAKLTVPLAQVLNVNPFYITGELDEPGEFSDNDLRRLLLKHGYRAILAEANLKRPYTRQAKEEEPAAEAEAAPEEAAPVVEAEAEAAPAVEMPPDSEKITEDDMVILLRGLAIQGKAGIPAAKDKFASLKALLLT